MDECVKNTSEMESETKAQRPQRRFWRCVRKMGEWQLTLLTFILFLPVWVLCNILLPRTLLNTLGVGTLKACWANTTKAKGTRVRKSPRSSSGTDPMGEQPRPRAARADSSSELPRNRLSIGNMEELARSLMRSLDMTEVCLDLLEKLKIKCRDGKSHVPPEDRMNKYPVCLQCRRCLTSSCLHCSEPKAQQYLPLLVVVLQRLSLVSYTGGLEPELDVKMMLIFELTMFGKRVYTWEKTQVLPERALETSCKDCDGSLPLSLWGSECSKAPHPDLGAQRTPEGQTGQAKDTRAAPDLHPAGQGESLPSAAHMYPRPPWAQPHSPAALERLHRAGLEPLPPVGYDGLGQGRSAQQRIRHSWATVKRSVRAVLSCQCITGSPEHTGTADWEQMVQRDLQHRTEALLHNTEMAV